MKYFIFTISVVFCLSTPAQELVDCSDIIRAPIQDQINLLLDVTFSPQALNLVPDEIYSSKVQNYVSWKDKQIPNCLADVIHRAEIEIRTIRGNEICTKTLVVHRKDIFTEPLFNSEYKIRDPKETCATPTLEEAKTLNACKAAKCGIVDDLRTFPDHLDDCKCKFFQDTLVILDQTGMYDGFFDLNSSFPKPEGVGSPFSK